MNSLVRLLVISFIFLFLTACGAGGGSEPASTPTVETPVALSGKIADGYLSDAKVCLDTNKNKVCDNNEPSTTSTSGGNYTLNALQKIIDTTTVLVEIIPGVTVDEDSPSATITKKYVLTAPAGKGAFVSPLTTMVQTKIETTGESAAKIEQDILASLGQLSTGVSLFKDYVAGKTSTANDTTKLGYEKLHQVAQITAKVVADNIALIETAVLTQNLDITLDSIVDLIVEKVITKLSVISSTIDTSNTFDATTIANSSVTISTTTLEEDVTNLETQKNIIISGTGTPAPSVSNFSSSSATITAGSSINLTAVFVSGIGSIDNSVGTVSSDVAKTVTPASTTTYTLTVTNSNNTTVTSAVTVTVVPAPSSTSFTTSSATITAGSSVNLTAVFVNGIGSINNSVGTVSSGVAKTVAPASTTTYTLTITNAASTSVTSTVTITVVPAPTISSFTTSSAAITAGASVNLTAVFVNGIGSIDNSVGTVSSGVAKTVTPASTTTYTLTITNAASTSVTSTVTITVVPAPTISSFVTTSAIITAGSSVNLTAVFANGIGSIDHRVGTVTSGTPTSVSPATTTTYTLTVTNTNSTSVTSTVTVTVTVVAPTITSFTTSSATITAGTSVNLTAVFANGAGSINNSVGNITSGVAKLVFPAATTTYTLTVKNTAGTTVTSVVTVTVGSGSTLLEGRTDGKGVDLVFIGDGFTASDQVAFNTAVDDYLTFHFGYNSTLTAQRKGWNIHRLNIISSSSVLDGLTPYQSNFGCFNTPRLICVNNSMVLNSVAAAVPQYDQIIVLVNSEVYGGSGGQVAVASLHASAQHILIHELGHSFAGLADEYTDVGTQAYISLPTTEPVEPNVTITNNTATVKWKDWIVSEPNVGLFEGGRYYGLGVWRPTINSFMNVLAEPFHPVNQEGWTLAQYAISGTHYSQTPVVSTVSHPAGQPLSFSIEPSIGVTSQKANWYVDDVLVPPNSFSFTCCSTAGNYAVRVEIYDSLGIIKRDPSNYSSSTVNWIVTVN